MVGNLIELLKSTGVPVAENVFKKKQSPPYMICRLINTDNFSADDGVYHLFENYMIELYSRDRDLISEGKIETALNTNEIFWNKTESYIASEELILMAYEI